MVTNSCRAWARSSALSSKFARSGRTNGVFCVLGLPRFEVLDAFDLDPPESLSVERRQMPQQATHLLVKCDEADQLFGSVKGEDFSAAGVRL
jgi:hypothetical protein